MNGAKRSAPSSSETPEMKRQRHEDNQFVSRVVFARGLPDDCLESELMALCIPFSSVEKCLLIPSKNQAFIELPDTTAASSLISFYQTHDAMVRGKKIFFAFSSRGEIFPQKPGDASASDSPRRDPRTRRSDRSKERSDSRTRSQPRNSQPRDRSQPRAAPFSAPPEPYYANQYQQPAYDANPATSSYIEQGQRNSILMVTISKLEYDVNVDILHQVFQSHGNVVKIVTFFKGNEFKALVQMQTVEQAEAAQQALNGRDIYTGCNTLHIVVSNHLALNVRYNNDQTRDYTNPNLPRGPEPQWEASAPRGMLGDGPRFNNQSAPPPANNNRNGRRSRSQSRERRDRRERRDSREFGRDGGRMPAPNNVNPRDFGPPRDFGRESSRPNEYPRSPVLICSNVDKHFMKVQSLFSFFGCFGDVMRIKIMFRKEGTSLVQFFNEDHAQSARKYLDGVVICGKKLRVDFSKHTAIIMPRSDAEEFEIINTVDFSNSPHHRYRRRSLTEAAPPSPLLHISGIPSSMQPRDYNSPHPIAAMFVNYGLVKKFHPIQKQPKMALVEMASLEEAIDSLIALDNYVFPDGRIRVSFSKSASRS